MNAKAQHPLVQEILSFWFGDDPARPLADTQRWFRPDDTFDRQVAARFGEHVEAAANGAFADWSGAPRPALALIILSDQFPRNIYRGSPRVFALDATALRVSLHGQEQGCDGALTPMERWFFYMPMMHSEDLDVQQRALAAFRSLAESAPQELRETIGEHLKYAVGHHDVIARFGRFPHRNEVLRRVSTEEELAWLKADGGH